MLEKESVQPMEGEEAVSVYSLDDLVDMKEYYWLSGNLRCWETLQFQQVNEELSVLAIRFFSNMVWMLYIICVTILVEIRLD